MILIIGDKSDNQIARVSEFLRQRGTEYKLVDPFGSVSLPELWIGPRRIKSEYTAIWDRLKPIAIGILDEEAQYIMRERVAAIRAVQWQNENATRQMNSVLATERAKSKYLQLKVAKARGVTIPRTYIGNDIDKICEFVEDCSEGAIAKSLTWYVGADARLSFTHRISERDLRKAPASVGYSPLIYQELIPKKYELRITCVGSRLFAAKIHSQERRKSKTDWRRDQFALRYEKTALPAELERGILRIQAGLGLAFGAYDFVLTPEDEYVFLEVNPSGNWLWLENQLHLPISKEIANWLIADAS